MNHRQTVGVVRLCIIASKQVNRRPIRRKIEKQSSGSPSSIWWRGSPLVVVCCRPAHTSWGPSLIVAASFPSGGPLCAILLQGASCNGLEHEFAGNDIRRTANDGGKVVPNNNKQRACILHRVRQCPLYRANMALNWIAPALRDGLCGRGTNTHTHTHTHAFTHTNSRRAPSEPSRSCFASFSCDLAAAFSPNSALIVVYTLV